MKRKIAIIGALSLLAVLLFGSAAVQNVRAAGETPTPPFEILYQQPNPADPGPDVIYRLNIDGTICVVDGGQLSCHCPCTTCQAQAGLTVTGLPPTDPPPTITPPPPTPPPPTPPPPKDKCNQGRGNGNEGCDPGNSNNHNPSNDEPGHRGGGH